MQPSYTAEDGMRTHAVEGYGILTTYGNRQRILTTYMRGGGDREYTIVEQVQIRKYV